MQPNEWHETPRLNGIENPACKLIIPRLLPLGKRFFSVSLPSIFLSLFFRHLTYFPATHHGLHFLKLS